MRLIDADALLEHQVEADKMGAMLVVGKGFIMDAPTITPQPDPKTGLVPCGCGGKAQIINSSGYSRRLYVECDRCAIMLGVEATGDGALQGIYRYDDQIIKDWNRAMGMLEVEG
mgnify:CR=1 FL=1|jgi:hypothetical protein